MEEKRIKLTGVISVGVTWVDGHVIFKSGEKWGNGYYGICHYGKAIFAFTPIDYEKPLMITTIEVSPKLLYCDHADTCIHFKCQMNRFKREKYYELFDGCTAFTLSMPKDFGENPMWFNEPPYLSQWQHFIIPIHGGILFHKETMKGKK